jgi:spore coat polysaccharide biosynthesis protein SpsF
VNNVRTLVVVPARMGSTRLPGKVLLPLAGKTLLERMVERVTAARCGFEYVVATTTDVADDPIDELCKRAGFPCFRGHPTDLLDRAYHAARVERTDTVVHIPASCALVDPAVIDRVVGAYRNKAADVDYVSNLHPPTYPAGNDVEVVPMRALEIAWRQARAPHERQHMTPFLWDQPDRFRVGNVTRETRSDASAAQRLVVETADDYEKVRAVYDALYTSERPIFSLADIDAFLDERENPNARCDS